MKKLFVILALAILLVPAIVMAVPSYCTWNGDPVLRYSFNMLNPVTGATNPPGSYNQPGPDFATAIPGQIVTQYVGLGDAGNAGSVPGCGITGAPDTFCTSATSKRGWVVTGSPALGSMQIQANGAGYVIYNFVYLTVPCGTTIGTKDTLIFREHYWNTKDMVCAPECGDCINPNLRSGVKYYNADTLIVTVVSPTSPLSIKQDSLTLVDHGATHAYVPFSICNTNACTPLYNYNIKSKGHVGAAINQSGSVSVTGGTCKDVYGDIDASTAPVCALDTLTIIAWGGLPFMYDTCVQIIHVISPQPVPLFTVPVVTILVLALILAAAVFMRRRAVSRA